jgi:hypothetical protein
MWNAEILCYKVSLLLDLYVSIQYNDGSELVRGSQYYVPISHNLSLYILDFAGR